MSFKKFISGVSAIAIAASAFAAMAVTANAETTTLYERALTGENAWVEADASTWKGNVPTYNAEKGLVSASGNGNRTATYTFDPAPEENAILSIEAVWNTGRSYGNGNYTYFNVGNSISIRAYSQDQKGEVVVGDNTYSISNACKKNQNRDSDNWTISMTIDTATNVVESLTIAGSNGTTKASYSGTNLALTSSATYTTLSMGSYKVSTDSSLGSSALNSIIVTQTAQDVSTADYTVNYLLGDTNIKTENKTGVIGNAPEFSNTTVVGSNNVTYVYVSDDADGVTIASDGTTVVNVAVRALYTYTASITSSIDNSVIASREGVSELDTVTLYHNRYIVKDGVAYRATRPLNNSSGYDTKLSYETQTVEITYNQAIDNVVYFAEAEDLGWNGVNDTARMSGGKGGYPSGESVITNLNPGKYVVYVATRGNTGSYFTVNAGTNAIFDNEEIHGYWGESVSSEFELSEATDISVSVTGGSSTKGIDYILIAKTGEYVAPVEKTEITVNVGSDSVTLESEEDMSGVVVVGYYDSNNKFLRAETYTAQSVINAPALGEGENAIVFWWSDITDSIYPVCEAVAVGAAAIVE